MANCRSTIAATLLSKSLDAMKSFLALVSVLLMALSLPAWADIDRDGAADMVQKASGGRILSVDKVQQEGRPVWRVKLLNPSGQVKVVLVDAATGRTL